MTMDSLDCVRTFAERIAIWQQSNAERFVVVRRAERVPEVSDLRKEIQSLGVKEFKYFSEGLDCIQYAQAPRAAIVLGWTGFIDLLQNRIGRDNFKALNSILKTEFHGIYKRKPCIYNKKDLCGWFDDALLLTAGTKLKLYDIHVHKQLDAMRDERNNCAHVEEYAVTVRIALGFYAKLIQFLPYTLR
jgi:hypothetical protein